MHGEIRRNDLRMRVNIRTGEDADEVIFRTVAPQENVVQVLTRHRSGCRFSAAKQ